MSEGRRSITVGGDMPLFSVAAHELKSPLALIRQLSQPIEADEYSHQEIAEILERIQLTSERALRLTTDLTKARRLEDSLFSLEPINCQSICEEIADELSPLYRAKGRRIEVAHRRSTPLIVGHRDLLRRVLLNFADNALNYAEADEPVILSTKVASSGSRVRIQVRDFGPGLSANLRDDMKSGPVPISRRPASSGLGLYLSRQFAEAMNGSIGTISHRDGASFYVELDSSAQLRLL